MIHKPTERGQALILIALAAIGLFAFAALAIDGSRAFSNKRHAQNAADTAVLTAALKYIRTGSYTDAQNEAIKRVNSNGYVSDADSSDGYATLIDVDSCKLDKIIDKDASGNEIPIPGDMKVDSAGVPILDASGKFIPLPCEGLPTGAKPEEYIRVKIISEIPTTFGRVIGRQTLKSAVEAVARAQGSAGSSDFPKDAVVALNDSTIDPIITGNGNAKFEVHNSGVFSNGTSTSCGGKKSSITLWTNYQPYSEKGWTTPSTNPASFCLSGITEAPGSGGFHTGAKLTPTYHIPEPTITCAGPAPADTGNAHTTGAFVHPGWHSSGSYPSGTYTFEAGNHCFSSGVNINTDAIANDVNILITSGGLKINTNGTFSCQNMIVSAQGGVELGGGGASGDINCTGVMFYVKSGSFKAAGNTNTTLTAPTVDPYAGLLVHLPTDITPPNTEVVHVGGTADFKLTGSIIAPGSHIVLKGTSNSAGFDTQIVGDTIDIDGTANVIINYNPANQYKPPAKPTIEFTK